MIETHSHQSGSLTVTGTAAQQLAAFVARHGKQVRLAINPGGCSGFDIAFAEGEPQTDDARFGPAGAELLIDPMSLSLISGATVDYVDQIGKEGFVIDKIPGMDARCGCGKSFSISE
ncbi:MAG: iron-sulfur cluster assembly accessory protein [Alphaproteobacteria bacterium]